MSSVDHVTPEPFVRLPPVCEGPTPRRVSAGPKSGPDGPGVRVRLPTVERVDARDQGIVEGAQVRVGSRAHARSGAVQKIIKLPLGQVPGGVGQLCERAVVREREHGAVALPVSHEAVDGILKLVPVREGPDGT